MCGTRFTTHFQKQTIFNKLEITILYYIILLFHLIAAVVHNRALANVLNNLQELLRKVCSPHACSPNIINKLFGDITCPL